MALLARLMRFAGIVVDDVTIAVLPSEVGEIVKSCRRAELVWCGESGTWSLVRTEVMDVRRGAFAQRGPTGEQ